MEPMDDVEFSRDLQTDIARLVREELTRHPPPISMHHQEGAIDMTALCTILKWIAGIASGLGIAGIIGMIVMYGDMQSMKGQIADLKTTVDHVYRLVEPHYRGDANGN